MEGQLFELEQLQHQLPLLEQATAKLEDLVGSSSSKLEFPQPSSGKAWQSGVELPSAESLSVRLEEAVDSASLLAAELQSIHRQHITTGLLLQQEEVKAKQLEADLAQTKVSSGLLCFCCKCHHFCYCLMTPLLLHYCQCYTLSRYPKI